MHKDKSATGLLGHTASWFPPLFFAAIALGTLPVIFTNLFVSPSSAAPGISAIAGHDYAVEQLAAFARHPLLIHAHALAGLGIVLAAPFQFWRSFRNRHRRMHRIMGYVTVACLAFLATSGLAVAVFYPFAGVAGMVPNMVWMCTILFATYRAVASIRARRVLDHEAWMTRALAMTFGITFASLYLPILTGVLHVASRTALAISFWLGVSECLAVGELWLRREGRSRRRARTQAA